MKLYGGDKEKLKEDLKKYVTRHYDTLSTLSTSSKQKLGKKINDVKDSLPTKIVSTNGSHNLKRMSAEEMKQLVFKSSKTMAKKIVLLGFAGLAVATLMSGPTQDPCNDLSEKTSQPGFFEISQHDDSELEYALIQPKDDAQLVIEKGPVVTSTFDSFLEDLLISIYGHNPLAQIELVDIDDNTCALKLPNNRVLAFVNGFPQEGSLSEEDYSVIQHLSEKQVNEDYQIVYVTNSNGAELTSLSNPGETTTLKEGTFHLSSGKSSIDSNRISISYINEDDKFIDDCSTEKRSVLVVSDIETLSQIIAKSPENRRKVDTSKDDKKPLNLRDLPSLSSESIEIPHGSIVYVIDDNIKGTSTNLTFSMVFGEKESSDEDETKIYVGYVVSDYLKAFQQQQQSNEDDGR